jgi:hypothetical protein
MEIVNQREPSKNLTTMGSMWVDDDVSRLYLFTLEDQIRPQGIKVPGETAIPAGRYQVLITKSARFKQYLPLIINVPMFDGIRIHSLNNRKQTEGCIGVGLERADEDILRSREAMSKLMNKIARPSGLDDDGAVRWELKEPTFITIKNG